MRRLTLLVLVLYAFAVPWEYSLDLGEPFGNVARIAGVLAILLAIPAMLASARLRPLGALQWSVLALYLFFALTLFWSISPDDTLEKIRAYFQAMLPVWLTWEFAEEPNDLRMLLRGLVAGCWLLALLVLVNLATYADHAQLVNDQARFVAEGQDPNDVARYLDLGMPFAAVLACTERGLLRWFAFGYLPVGLLAVLATASRGGFAGAVVAFAGIFVLMFTRNRRALIGTLIVLPVIAALVALAIPRASFERLETIPDQIRAGDLNDRVSIWLAGWIAFSEAPILGHGAGSYVAAARTATGDTAHNTVLAILVTGGLVALGLLTGAVAAVARASLSTRGMWRIMLLTELAVWIITSMVGSVEENRMTWLVFALCALAGRLHAASTRTLEAPAAIKIRSLPA